jgi:glycosyltransferase involved in cell wall biosynthesis
MRHLDEPVTEFCLETAAPISADAIVVSLRHLSPQIPRLARPAFRYVDLANLEAAWRRLARRVELLRPEVVYVNPCRFLQAPALPLQSLPPAVYFCDEVRRVDYEHAAAARRNRRTRSLYAPLYARERHLDRATATRAALIATNSNYTAGEISRVYGRAATVITMGVADAFLQPRATGGEAAGRERFVLSVGSLLPSKGHDLVIRAAAAAGLGLRVVIVAPRSDPDEERRLAELASQTNVEIEVLKGISDHELRNRYDRAFATLYLAEREPLGLASIEAQARGCPVIVADEGGLPETIKEGLTGWAIPRDAQAVASLLGKLVDPSLRKEMSAAAMDYAQRWSWRASAAEVKILLRSAAHTMPPAR